MKIAFLNRGRETHEGGDLIALDATMQALRAKGVECLETGWNTKAIADFNPDVAHLFHCNFDWSYGNYQAVISELFTDWDTRPYVLTPVFYPGLYFGVTKEQVQEIVFGAKLVLPFSRHEGQEMREELGWLPFEAIPNGTEEAFHCTDPARDREGVLCVSARGENDKNIPFVRKICEELKIPFTCATGIPHDQMPAVYNRHRVFVNASDSERMSLTVGEALCAGCRVIDNSGNRGAEWYRHVFRRSVRTTLDLDEMIRSSHSHLWPYDEMNSMACDEARALTWSNVADRLIEVYRWAAR